MTTETTRQWTIWADFDDEGDPTGHTIIGDLAGRAVFCSVEATPGEIALAVRLPEVRTLLMEAARLMPGSAAAGQVWRERAAALLVEVAAE